MTSRGGRILIVEDAEDLRACLAELLTAEGYNVTCAGSGREALALLDSAEQLPQLLLLDLMMPDMDGLEFRARQRADPRFGPIPIVLMTAAGDVQATAAELGACDCLKKPFKDIPTILQVIDRCIAATPPRCG
jgi:CheY-like chemotaxis protein